MDGSTIHGANLTTIVYGADVPSSQDCSEVWFEASKIYNESMGWDCPGVQALQSSPELRVVSSRGAKSFDNLARIDLGSPRCPASSLESALLGRRSADIFTGTMTESELSGLLRYGAGMTDVAGQQSHLRTVPSAGALHPLDLFVYVRNVSGVEEGVYYYLPQEDRVVLVAGSIDEAVADSFFNATGSAESAVIFFLAASFWRSRFKYGHRGMRFCLMESGHLAQNLLLLASAYDLPARALGGFVDCELNELIPTLNGVDTALLYALAVG